MKRVMGAFVAAAFAGTLLLPASPAAATPITIPISVTQWAYANSGNVNGSTTDAFIGPGDPSPAATALRVGKDSLSNHIYRGFLRFPLTGVPQGQVLSVQLVGRADHTWACTARPTFFYRTAPITVTPRQPWPGPAQQVLLGNNNVTANEGGACGPPAANAPFSIANFTLVSDVQAALNAGQPFYYVGFSAGSSGGLGESNLDRWMRYFVNDFQLIVSVEPAP